MALTVRQEYDRAKRRTPRSVLRQRHGIKLGFDEGGIARWAAWALNAPSRQQDAVYARVADQLRPQRESLDHAASLAMLDCDIERRQAPEFHRPPTRDEIRARYRAPSLDAIDARLAVLSRSIPRHAGRNIAVGLASAYCAVLFADECNPWVIAPDAYCDVRADALAVQFDHCESLTLAAPGRTWLTLDDDPHLGLFVKLTLPAGKLGDAVACALRAGELGLSIGGMDPWHEVEVDGVTEVHAAALSEISFTHRPRQRLCRAVLACSSPWLPARDSWSDQYLRAWLRDESNRRA